MAPYTFVKMPEKGAGLRNWEENQDSFDIFSLKCLLVVASSDIKSRVRREVRTKNLNLGIVHRKME